MVFPYKKVKTKTGIRYKSVKTGKFVPKSVWEPLIHKQRIKKQESLIRSGKKDAKFRSQIISYADARNISYEEATKSVRNYHIALLHNNTEEARKIYDSPIGGRSFIQEGLRYDR